MTQDRPDQQPPPIDDNPETIEFLSQVFQDWKREHPDGTWRKFWAAVAAGEVEIPSS